MSEIDGVLTKSLRVIPDERGRLMEILRNDDEIFERFGQVYMTTNGPGVVKAWHLHDRQTDMVCCVKGMIKLVLFDAREGSATKGTVREYFIGDHNPLLVRVPPGVYHGWKGISTDESVTINIPTEAYDYAAPDERRLAWDAPDIPYDWEIEFK